MWQEHLNVYHERQNRSLNITVSVGALSRVFLFQAAEAFFGGDVDQVMLNHAQLPEAKNYNGSVDDMNYLRQLTENNFLSTAHLFSLSYQSLLRSGGSVGVMSSLSGIIIIISSALCYCTAELLSSRERPSVRRP